MCSSHKSTLLSQDLHSFIESPQKWDNSGYYVILQLSRRWYLNIENVNQIHEKQTLNFACNKHTNINSWIYKNIGLSILITAASLYRIYIFFSLIKKKKKDTHPPKFTDFLWLSLYMYKHLTPDIIMKSRNNH